MKAIWEHQVGPRIANLACKPMRTLRMVFGSIAENKLDKMTRTLRKKYRSLDWTILASDRHVELVGKTSDSVDLQAVRMDFAQTMRLDLALVKKEGGLEIAIVGMSGAQCSTVESRCSRRNTQVQWYLASLGYVTA